MKKRLAWIIGGAIAAVVAAGALVWLLLPRSGAEEHALAYLQALADGDITAVEATGVDVSATAAAAFADASEHLSAVAIESSTAGDQSADVVVSYELAGERHESILTLSQHKGRWVPDAASALGSVQFSVPAGIADAVLSADEIVLLPAVYEASVSPSAFLDGSATVEVPLSSTQQVDIDAALRPEAAEIAQTQLDEYLGDCTKPAAEAPPACGITIPWAADFSQVSEIRYRVEQSPTISLPPTGFLADGGVLVATVTGTAHDGSAKTLTYRSTNWSVRGDVSFADDDIVLSVW